VHQLSCSDEDVEDIDNLHLDSVECHRSPVRGLVAKRTPLHSTDRSITELDLAPSVFNKTGRGSIESSASSVRGAPDNRYHSIEVNLNKRHVYTA
jgi:hypothetical protein